MVQMCKELGQPHSSSLNKSQLFDNIVDGLQKQKLPLVAKTVYEPSSSDVPPPRTFALPSPSGGKKGDVTFEQGKPITAEHLDAAEALARQVEDLSAQLAALGAAPGKAGAKTGEQ
jgi:hypothetical protein